MRELGYVEARNVVFEQRYGGGRMDLLPRLAAELVRLQPEAIVTGTNVHVAAVRQATNTIPIVMVFTFDPVTSGFVESLARPGGNVTALSADSSSELWAKYLALLRELVPGVSRIGVIGQKSVEVGFAELDQASGKLGVSLEIADPRSPDDFDTEFAGLISRRVNALLNITDRSRICSKSASQTPRSSIACRRLRTPSSTRTRVY